ncbi:MAG: T9SS type A sorting domain-containing protein, partial [Melioribacteraceae bacterium]|nr:T9SS type A sorting domain-containing protein [Melioribacteraceae bacterium]
NNTVQIINRSITEIKIDSIHFDSSILYVRNNNFSQFPISIEPDSSISIDVLLANYFTLVGDDSSTVISIFNNSRDTIKYVNVSINFQMIHRMGGILSGSVRDSLSYLPGAKVYFFFDGIYLTDSTITDNNGNYEKELRYGNYFVSAKKDGYYIQYGYLKDSPLDADFIDIRRETPRTVDFILDAEVETDLSISGFVHDIVSDLTLSKAIVVVRKGDHLPTKIQASTQIDPLRDYTVMTNSRGEFSIDNIQIGGNYYLQAFSQYYIPGYFNNMFRHEVLWQNGDSIDVAGFETGRNIYLDRDSSFGGGLARGHLRLNNNQSDSSNNAIIYAVSTSNKKVYNFSFSQSSGQFGLPSLPSGTYNLVTDRIGFESSISAEFAVDTTQDTVENIELILLPTSIEHTPQKVTTFNLSQNYPNPFNPTTTIEFTISKNENVSLVIYNLLGQKVSELLNGNYTSGSYKITFDASQLSSGIYIYELRTASNVIAKKMELLK